jgi:glutaredoxin-related protein
VHLAHKENNMTIIIFGNEACTACKQALNEISKTPMDFKYVDVSTIQGYEGDIPAIQFEDGAWIIGLGPILNYIKEWKKENGFL